MKPRRRKCAHCRETFQPWNTLQRACSPSCAAEVAAKNAEKRLRQWRREERERLKTLSELCVAAQRPVNQYIRLRDAGKGCISCPSSEIHDAGHFFPVGSKYRTSRLRFDPRNLNGQCSKCNRYAGGGNRQGYIDGYVARYGAAALKALYELQRMADQGALAPLTKDEVRQIAADHRRMIRDLKGS